MKRQRNIQIHFFVNEDEKKLIREKMKEVGANSYTDMFLMTIQRSNIYHVDMTPILALKGSIDKVGTNINQIAKVVNTTQNAYKNDIIELQQQFEKVEKLVQDFCDYIYNVSR